MRYNAHRIEFFLQCIEVTGLKKLFLVFFAIYAFLNPSPALSRWVQIETENFRLFSKGNLERSKQLGVKLEKLDAMLRLLHRIDSSSTARKVEIYLVESDDKVRELGEFKTSNVAGFLKSTERGVFGVVPMRDTSRSEYALTGRQILFHEYVHAFMAQHVSTAYPAWYREGIADFYSTVEFRDSGEIWLGKVVPNRVPSATRKKLFDTKKLLTIDSRDIATQDRGRYYATGWLLTHFLFFNDERKGELTRYLKAINAGQSSMSAASKFSGGAGGLSKDLKTYSKSRRLSYSKFELINFPTQFPMKIDPLSADRSELMEMEIRLRSRMSKQRALKLLPDLQKITDRYPNSSFAHWISSEFLRRSGDNIAAEAAIDRAIELDPGNGKALIRKARFLITIARKSEKDQATQHWSSARNLIVQANRVDVEDPVPLYLFYHIGRGQKKRTSDLMFSGLKKAQNLIPQYGPYRVRLAIEYAKRDEFETAQKLLFPVVFSAHQSSLRDRARKLYDKIEKDQTGNPIRSME
ncbi:MAG: DUF1570 domain-containing protein [Parasphingorhabdus sp.]